MSKMCFQGRGKLQVKVLCETLLTSGKGFSVQNANVAAGKKQTEVYNAVVIARDEMGTQRVGKQRETAKFQCTGIGAVYIKGILKRINTMIYSKR